MTLASREPRAMPLGTPVVPPLPPLPPRDRFDSIDDVARLARHRLPRPMFERLVGGADRGVTTRANEQAFADVWFRSRGAAAHPQRSLVTTVAGREIALPVALGPVGALRLQHPDGALAAIAAAAAHGTICMVSPGSGHSLAEIDLPDYGHVWYQLTTALAGREGAERDLAHLVECGYGGLVVTIDSVLRAKVAPIRISARSIAEFGPDLVRRPRWTYRFVRDGMRIGVANQATGAAAAPSGARPVSWDDFAWIRAQWTGPLVIKGILSGEDTRRAIDAGADAVVVSNHGGLTLDGSMPTLWALADVLDATGGRVDVLLDGGIRSGNDVVKALALGARAVLLGRPYVMGLAVGGAAGVGRVLELVREDIDRALAFLGCRSVSELDGSHVYVRR